MSIKYKIHGDDMQLVEISLSTPVRAEPGAMVFMDESVQMDTSTGGGMWKGFKRALTGDRFFITTFSGKGNVAFAAPYPGKIIPIDIKGKDYICQRDSFLCAEKVIDIDIAFTKKFRAGFFGGEGFILQKLSGDGKAFVHAGGTVIEKTLKSGETLKVDTGCIVAFESHVDYSISFVGGFKNTLFGGEGLFLATLKGPGKVYLQSLPFSRLAQRVMKATRKGRGEKQGPVGRSFGNILGGDHGF